MYLNTYIGKILIITFPVIGLNFSCITNIEVIGLHFNEINEAYIINTTG